MKNKPEKIYSRCSVSRNTLLSLGAGLVAVLAPLTVHAQNLYVTVLGPGTILEYTPSGVQSTYATGLSAPRGLAFDSIGNLFAAETVYPDPFGIGIGRVLKYNLRNKVSTFGTVRAGRIYFSKGWPRTARAMHMSQRQIQILT